MRIGPRKFDARGVWDTDHVSATAVSREIVGAELDSGWRSVNVQAGGGAISAARVHGGLTSNLCSIGII